LSTDLALLESEIRQRGDVRLVIIDPISSYLGKTDSHKNSDVRGVLEPISEMAERLRVAILGITHLSKGDGRAINRFIGSIAFVAAARAAFAVVTDPDDETGLRKLFLEVKNNIAPPAPGLAFRLEQMEISAGIVASAVAWDSSPVTTTADQAMGAIEAGSHTATDDAVEFLRGVLVGGPMAAKEIERLAVEAGLLGDGKPIGQCKAFRLARKELGIEPARVGGLGAGGQWVWNLPTDTNMPSLAYDAPIPGRGTLDGLGHLSGEGATQ
jgi:AAA domain